MAGKPRTSYPTPEELVDLVRQVGSIQRAAQSLGIVPQTLDSWLDKQPGLRELCAQARLESGAPSRRDADAGRAVGSTDPKEWRDIDALLRTRGLDPDEWVVTDVRVNQWADHDQLRVDLKPGGTLIVPARRDAGWRPPRVAAPPSPEGGQRIVAFSDHHVPWQDAGLLRAACAITKRFRPHVGALMGDLLDLGGEWSKYLDNPAWPASALQDVVDTAYETLAAHVASAPGARWMLLEGNHDARLKHAQLARLRGLYGVRRAKDLDEHPVLSLPYLLRLDELGIEYVGGGDEYQHYALRLADNVAARHGVIAKRGAGASVLATIAKLQHHLLIGHVHRQAVVAHSHRDIDGAQQTLVGVEVGCMCRTVGGLGYDFSPDWQAGFAVATVWPDGSFLPELVRWDGEAALWRGQRWAAA